MDNVASLHTEANFQYYRLPGADIKEGDVLLEAGTVLGPAEVSREGYGRNDGILISSLTESKNGKFVLR